jgi:hypothetical protein
VNSEGGLANSNGLTTVVFAPSNYFIPGVSGSILTTKRNTLAMPDSQVTKHFELVEQFGLNQGIIWTYRTAGDTPFGSIYWRGDTGFQIRTDGTFNLSILTGLDLSTLVLSSKNLVSTPLAAEQLSSSLTWVDRDTSGTFSLKLAENGTIHTPILQPLNGKTPTAHGREIKLSPDGSIRHVSNQNYSIICENMLAASAVVGAGLLSGGFSVANTSVAGGENIKAIKEAAAQQSKLQKNTFEYNKQLMRLEASQNVMLMDEQTSNSSELANLNQELEIKSQAQLQGLSAVVANQARPTPYKPDEPDSSTQTS